ncbi:SDR family NAD(P)-dependent oxidoreductase [Streptomyces sp. NPDC060194]|uniref:SDR family NAD(P)-dependent oxidoreductase n=1 Tax=Streptomyces sp. NPDC060194 TaxID=3347069 RepID=UPI00366622CF
MHNELRNTSALVMGGSRGLGLLLAARLTLRGNRVTIAARDKDELREGAAWIAAHAGAEPSIRVCDVRDDTAVRTTVDDVAAQQDGLDAVFANAGIIQVAPLDALTPDDFRDAMDTMFHGCVRTALAALPHLRRSPAGGRLVLTGSVGGLLGVPHLVPYSCAKSAIGTLAEGLSAELAGSGVSVTAAHPGLMRTGSHLKAEFGGPAEREYAWFSALSGTPLVSMDAERAAERIVRAAERRRPRVVLTPAAHAASLAHGLAPALTTRLTGVAARLLPSADAPTDTVPGETLPTPRPRSRVLAGLHQAGRYLNDKAATRLNQLHRTEKGNTA